MTWAMFCGDSTHCAASDKPFVAFQEFNSKKACVFAQEVLTKRTASYDGRFNRSRVIMGVCVPKG